MLKPFGSFWIKLTKDEQPYFSGTVEIGGKKCNLVLFRNRNRRNDEDPDYSAWLATKLKTKRLESPRKSEEDEGEIQYRY